MLSDPSLASPSAKVPGLNAEERRHLLMWLESARASGIDATEDLRMRPWPVAISASIIGVFRAGDEMASWLVIGQNGLWTVVSVSEGGVLATLPSLTEALAVIHPPRPAPTAPRA